MDAKKIVKNQPITAATIDDYLADLPEDVRNELQRIRTIISSTVPGLKERIAYKICVFSLKKDVVGFASHKKWCSFYTMSPPLVKSMEKDLQDYRVSGTTIHFAPQEPLPESLIKKIVRARLKEMSEKK
jgi:uncharacterized protein YdhG (YjbR/CyaY superfamily)